MVYSDCALILSCLEGNCASEVKCLFERTGTIFHCPKGNLSSQQDFVTYEEWVTEDVTSHSYIDPLQYGDEAKVFHGVPPTRRIKSIWKKRTRTRLQFINSRWFSANNFVFTLTASPKLMVLLCSGWTILRMQILFDRQEQQSDYYDRYFYTYISSHLYVFLHNYCTLILHIYYC